MRRWWWELGAGVAVGLAGGAVALVVTQPVYESSTTVLVADGDGPSLETEARLVTTTEVLADVAARLGGPVHPPSVVVAAGVLEISYEAQSPTLAQAGARAFAESYLASRVNAAQARRADQLAAITAKLAEINGQLADLTIGLERLPAGAPEEAGMRATVTSLAGQATELTTRSAELSATPVEPGRVLREADLPTRRVRPEPTLYLGLAALAGLALAAAVTLARDRLARRVRDGAGIARRSGVPLLATVPAEIAQQPYDRLRNEIVSLLGPRDQVILVTGADPGPASTLVAASLAASLARAEAEVVLVGANATEFGAELTLPVLFDVGDVPGFTDAVTGRAPIARTLQRAPRNPRLRVVAPGGGAAHSGLLQIAGVRAVLTHLRLLTEYVLIDAPSTASSADAQSLAGAADAAIIVARAGVTAHDQVADAATQLQRVGTRVLGVVVVDAGVTPDPAGSAVTPPVADVWITPRRLLDPPTTVLEQVAAAPDPSLRIATPPATAAGAPTGADATPAGTPAGTPGVAAAGIATGIATGRAARPSRATPPTGHATVRGRSR